MYCCYVDFFEFFVLFGMIVYYLVYYVFVRVRFEYVLDVRVYYFYFGLFYFRY